MDPVCKNNCKHNSNIPQQLVVSTLYSQSLWKLWCHQPRMVDLVKLTRRWLDGPSSWLCSSWAHNHISTSCIFNSQSRVNALWTDKCIMCFNGWHRGTVIERRTYDQEVVRSILGQWPGTRRKNLGQVSHTYVPLSPSSISWYWPKGGNTRRLVSNCRPGRK